MAQEDGSVIILDRALDSYPEGDTIPNEIEFALTGYTDNGSFDPKWTVGIDRYGKILKGFIKQEGVANPQPTIMITVTSDKSISLPADVGGARARIIDDGTGRVAREFCISNTCKDDHTTYELKKRLKLPDGASAVDMPEYGIRIRYSTEHPLPQEHIEEFKNGIQGKKLPKRYRYAQRYTIDLGKVGKSGTKLSVDFSSVKMNEKEAYSFSGAQIVGMCATKVQDRYEVEVDLSNPRGVSKDDLREARTKIQEVLRYLVTQVQGGYSTAIVSNNKIAYSLKNYVILCRGQPWGRRLKDVMVGDTLSQQTMVDTADYFLGPAIATLNRDILKRGILLPKADSVNYFFTDKADGDRCLMYIDHNLDLQGRSKCYLLMKSGLMLGSRDEGLTRTLMFCPTDLMVHVPPSSSNDAAAGVRKSKYTGTVLDGELINVGGKFYYLSFDIIIYQGQYVDSASFIERYTILQKIAGDCDTLKLMPKTFSGYTPEVFDRTIHGDTYRFTRDDNGQITKIMHQSNGIWYDLDGIVFQPANDPYPALETNWNKVFKFKTMYMLTVDLHLSYDRKLIKIDSNTLGITQQERPDVYAHFITSYNEKGKLSESPHPCYAKVVNGYPRTEEGEPINKGNIVECRMITTAGKPYWEPIRIRHDKHKPNSIFVHQQIMDQLYEPIAIGNLSEKGGGFGGKHNITDHNRWVSNRYIIRHVSKITRDNIRLLDLACGNIKSGSAWMAIQKRFRENDGNRVLKIVGIDNCRDKATNIATSYIYMSNINAGASGEPLFKPQNYDFFQENMLIPLHNSDNARVREQTNTPESFNVITCVFAIYYTFGSEANFRAFLANVSRNLKIGGFFICSYMNGNSVRALIQKSGGGQATGDKIWTLRQLDDPDDSPFGHQVEVTFDGLYDKNLEFLVDLSDATVLDMMNQYGLEFYNTESFTTDNQKIKLTENEKTWAKLHTNTCFRKVKISDKHDVYDNMFNADFQPGPKPKPKPSSIKAPSKSLKTPSKSLKTPTKLAATPTAKISAKPVVKISATVKPSISTSTAKISAKPKLTPSLKPKAAVPKVASNPLPPAVPQSDEDE